MSERELGGGGGGWRVGVGASGGRDAGLKMPFLDGGEGFWIDVMVFWLRICGFQRIGFSGVRRRGNGCLATRKC